MKVIFTETAPASNALDILAMQACSQVRFANTKLELFNAMRLYLSLSKGPSIDTIKGYHLVDNTILQRIELWKVNEEGDRVCMLLTAGLQSFSLAEVAPRVFTERQVSNG